MIPYDTAESLHHMGIILKHLQTLTYPPTFIIIPKIKAINGIVHQLLPLITFEPIIDTKLQQSLMDELLYSLRTTTSTYFTTKYQALQDAPCIL